MLLLNRMAVHEAGHAIARLYFQLGPIIEITIEARDGGYVLGAFSQDEQTEELLTVFLIAHLAGRAAEEEILGSATSNSGGSEQSDLALATGLALDDYFHTMSPSPWTAEEIRGVFATALDLPSRRTAVAR